MPRSEPGVLAGCSRSHCRRSRILLPGSGKPRCRSRSRLFLASLQRDDDSRRVIAGVRQADVPLGQAKFRGDGGCRAVQEQGGAVLRVVTAHLDLAPAYGANPGSERLGNRLLGRQPRRQPVRLVFTVCALARREKAVEITLAKPVQPFGDTAVFDQINSTTQHATSFLLYGPLAFGHFGMKMVGRPLF